MAGQPTSPPPRGYWIPTALAPFFVQPLLGSYIVGASTFPVDLYNLEEMIAERSAEFDQAAMKSGYAVPVPTTATHSFLVAKRVVRDGVQADVLRQVYTGPDPKYVDRYEKAYQDALKAIATGTMALVDAGDSASVAPVWSGVPSAQMTATIGAAGRLIPTDF